MISMTNQQRENLKTLSAYLRGLPSEYSNFHMNHHFISLAGRPLDYKEIVNVINDPSLENGLDCGVICCALSHSIFCVPEVAKFFLDCSGADERIWRDWKVPSEVAFGFNIHSEEWSFLFYYGWSSFDNTPVGAANRIDYFLKNGLRGVPSFLEGIIDSAIHWEPEDEEAVMNLIDLYNDTCEVGV